jgi:hypothetical protein
MSELCLADQPTGASHHNTRPCPSRKHEERDHGKDVGCTRAAQCRPGMEKLLRW